MTHKTNAIFHHRHNENGTVDSICPRCYLTIATAKDEQHLFRREKIHNCDLVLLHQIANCILAAEGFRSAPGVRQKP